MAEPVLKIHVTLDEVYRVGGAQSEFVVIPFCGECESRYFRGTILPGAADTQRKQADGRWQMSARYLMQGTDAEGKNCQLFIENNGVTQENGEICTHPVICTDSKCLQWLESEELEGRIEGIDEKHIWVLIYRRCGNGSDN